MGSQSENLCYDDCDFCGKEILPGEERISLTKTVERCDDGVVRVTEAILLRCYCIACAEKLDIEKVYVPTLNEDRLYFETVEV